jgi:glucokinase
LVDHAEDHETCVSETLLAEVLVYRGGSYTCGGLLVRLFSIMSKYRFTDTYVHRSVRTGHLVRNHKIPFVFLAPGTEMF